MFNRTICNIECKVFLYDKQKEIIKKHLIREFKKLNVSINTYKFKQI